MVMLNVPALVTQTVSMDIPSWVIFWAFGGMVSAVVAFIVLRCYEHEKIGTSLFVAIIMFVAWVPLIMVWALFQGDDARLDKKEIEELKDKISLLELEKSNTKPKRR